MQKIKTRNLTFLALLTALSVVLRLVAFPQNSTFRIELAFLPIAVAGSMFGSIGAGVSYLIADVVGTFCVGQAPIPTITICKILTGIIFGLFFYKRKKSIIKIVCAVILITIFIDLLAMPYALMPIMGGKSFFVILSDRFYAALFNVPLRIITIYVTFKYLNPIIEKEVEKNEHR
ncbi:MAG: folate family ECF transporter S component [Clostridia bacterium]|nr:folate family ECF transporter S component [Clostridia bacterium]